MFETPTPRVAPEAPDADIVMQIAQDPLSGAGGGARGTTRPGGRSKRRFPAEATP